MLIQRTSYKKMAKNYRRTIEYILNGKVVESNTQLITAGCVDSSETVEVTAPVAAWYRLAKGYLTLEMESKMLIEEGYRQ